MKHYLRLIFLLCLPAMAVAQHHVADSLKNAFKTARTDTARLSALASLTMYYYEDNRDTALYYINKALPIAQKNSLLLDVATILDFKGYELTHLGRYPESFLCLQQALEIASDAKNESKTFFVDRRSTPVKTRLNLVASIHQHLGHLMGRTNNTAGQINEYKQAAQLSRQAGSIARLGNLNMSLGRVYINLNRLDSAMVFETKAEKIFKQLGGSSYLTNVYVYVAQIYSKKGNRTTELEYVRKALSNSFKQANNSGALSMVYGYLSNYYIGLKQPDSALYYAKKTLGFLREMQVNNTNGVNNLFYKAYQLKHNTDSAYKYQGLVLAASDSTYKSTIKNLSDFQQLSFKDQLRLRDIEKEKELLESRVRTYVLVAVVTVFILLSIIFYRNYRQKQKANLALNQQKDEIELQRDNLTRTLTDLKATQTQLIQSEKMASLGELTAGIAHEIQNPLNFVNNFSEVNAELIDEMQEELDKGELGEAKAIANDIKENQQKISQHGKRADFIVKGMLQHSRTSTGERQPTNVNVLAEEFLKLSYHGLRARDKSFNAEWVTDFDGNLPGVDIVQQEIGRVLLNLFNNAFYAVNQKKKIAGDDYKPQVTVSTSSQTGQVMISVKDNGTGIPESIKEKIMQPFFTTKPTGEGTGLRLSLSYEVVKGHGGSIDLKSSENEGSEFIVTLPLKSI